MKPDDKNGHLPIEARPFRVLIISGSNRRQYNCPGVDSKSRALMLRMAARLPQEWEIDYEDLGNVYARAQIRSCNACVSTSMALCVWPCLPAVKGSWELICAALLICKLARQSPPARSAKQGNRRRRRKFTGCG